MTLDNLDDRTTAEIMFDRDEFPKYRGSYVKPGNAKSLCITFDRRLSPINEAAIAKHLISGERVSVAALITELEQARNYVKVIADRTTEQRVHDDLKKIDDLIAKARAS